MRNLGPDRAPFAYEDHEPRSDWGGAVRGENPYDNLDFHVDLGCGTIPKARVGVDHFHAPGVDIVLDLERARLPFRTSTIKSIISHHCLEHVGDGFIPLMKEIHRVLEPGGILRVIVPLFPSTTAVSDPDHRRYFMEDTFAGFLVSEDGESWLSSFSVPYSGTAKFRQLDKICTPPTPFERGGMFGPNDNREMRIALEAWKK